MKHDLNKFSFYASLLKYALSHPKVGIQIIDTAYQVWSDSKKIVNQSDEIFSDIGQVLKKMFPNITFSISDVEHDMSSLKNHIENFAKQLENETFPSRKKPYPLNYSMDNKSGLLLYLICKITKPEKVVETGVAYGLSSSYILQALHENKKGKLYSIDYSFRPWESKEMIGSLIPANFKDRWELVYGLASDKLHKVLRSLGSIDIFVHDSMHTYKNMMFEFKISWPFIKKGGYLISDDALGNNAFLTFCSSLKLKPLLLQQENMSKSCSGILQKI